MNLRELFYSRMRSLGIYDLSKGTQSLVCCEIESYLRVLEPLFDEIEWLRKNAVVSSCSPERLAQYERMLAIPVKQQIPEEKRREIVQSKMAIGPSDFHREGIEQSLSALGIRAKVEEMPEKGTILVTALEIADSSMTLDQAKEAFQALMPAHLLAEFVTGGISFLEFDQLDKSFAQLDQMDKSWSQLEMMGIEEWQKGGKQNGQHI